MSADPPVTDGVPSSAAFEAVTLHVPEMDCPEEVSLIEAAWAPLEGVIDVRTNLLDRTATALIDPDKTEAAALQKALKRAGLNATIGIPPRPPIARFHIPAFYEPETRATLSTALAEQPGVTDYGFMETEETISVTYDPAVITVSGVHQALLATGVVVQHIEEGPSRPLRLMAEAEEKNGESVAPTSGFVPPPEPIGGTFIAPPNLIPPAPPAELDPLLVMLGLGLFSGGVGAALLHLTSFALAGKVLLGLTAGVMGWRTLRRAFTSLRMRRLDMHVLMSIATIGAILIGEWTEGAALMWLFALSMWIERWNMNRARSAVKGYAIKQPTRVRVLVGGSWDQIPIERVNPGTRALVRPGELIPLDGTVISGEAAVDEATVTGEAMPVNKEAGSPVFAGTLCTNGMLEFIVTRGYGDSTVQRLRDLVLDAQTSRAPLQGTVDRFAASYTPFVIGLALVVAIFPPLVFGFINPQLPPAAKMLEWHEWIYRGLALLVLACPCALVISTPVAFIAALGQGARRGMLIKGGRVLEATARLRAMAFDKTGTLTTGHPELTHLLPLGVKSEQLTALALALETHATHPIALAIARYAATTGIQPMAGLTGFRQLGGKGVEGWLGQTSVAIGAMPFLIERGVKVQREHLEMLREAESWGATIVGVASGQRLVGLLGFQDPLREDAREVLLALRQLGISRIELLTGDNQTVAQALGRELPLDAVHANLLPEDKQTLLNVMTREYGLTGMVGDGLNDAPALGSAAVGIALGEQGVDVALQTADVVLIGEELSKVPELVELSRRTVRIIQENIALALAVKAIFGLAVVLGWAGLWAAVLGDMGGSLLVTLNSLRLLRR